MKGTIYKRGKTYTYVVDIGKDPTTGKRKQKSQGGFLRKKDAQTALNKILYELNEEIYVEPSKEPFNSFIKDWFYNHYIYKVKTSTANTRKYLLEKHLVQENPFSNKTISEISTQDIDLFYTTKIKEGYSSSYIRKIHQLLSSSFKQAVIWKKIQNNPAENTKPPSVTKKDIKIWSIEEVNRFLDGSLGERLHILFILAIYTGMRRGEILGLKWSDIDFKNRLIHVKRTLSYLPNEGYNMTTPKTIVSKRKISFSDEVLKKLIQHKNNQQKWKDKLKDAYQDNNLIVCTDLGTYQDPRNVLRVLDRLCKTIGVPNIRFHDLRHTHASILIASNVDIVKVSARLGHANPRITLETYAHLLPNEQHEVAELFEEVVSKSLAKEEDSDKSE